MKPTAITPLDRIRSTVCTPGIELTENAALFGDKITLGAVSDFLARFAAIEAACPWFIGDGINAYCDQRAKQLNRPPEEIPYHEELEPLIRREGRIIRYYRAVALAFDPGNRCRPLSWTHHLVAMDAPPEKRGGWLQEAAANNWSVSDLRKRVRLSLATHTTPTTNPTGNGYSAILDADRWAATALDEVDSYTPERAQLILADIERLVALVDRLRAITHMKGEDVRNVNARFAASAP